MGHTIYLCVSTNLDRASTKLNMLKNACESWKNIIMPTVGQNHVFNMNGLVAFPIDFAWQMANEVAVKINLNDSPLERNLRHNNTANYIGYIGLMQRNMTV